MNQEAFAFDKAKRNVRHMRQTLFAVSIEDNVPDPGRHHFFKPIAQAAGMFVAFEHFLLCQFSRNSESDDVWNRLCACAPVSFLMSANLLRQQPNSSPNEQCSDALGRVHLMR